MSVIQLGSDDLNKRFKDFEKMSKDSNTVLPHLYNSVSAHGLLLDALDSRTIALVLQQSSKSSMNIDDVNKLKNTITEVNTKLLESLSMYSVDKNFSYKLFCDFLIELVSKLSLTINVGDEFSKLFVGTLKKTMNKMKSSTGNNDQYLDSLYCMSSGYTIKKIMMAVQNDLLMNIVGDSSDGYFDNFLSKHKEMIRWTDTSDAGGFLHDNGGNLDVNDYRMLTIFPMNLMYDALARSDTFSFSQELALLCIDVLKLFSNRCTDIKDFVSRIKDFDIGSIYKDMLITHIANSGLSPSCFDDRSKITIYKGMVNDLLTKKKSLDKGLANVQIDVFNPAYLRKTFDSFVDELVQNKISHMDSSYVAGLYENIQDYILDFYGIYNVSLQDFIEYVVSQKIALHYKMSKKNTSPNNKHVSTIDLSGTESQHNGDLDRLLDTLLVSSFFVDVSKKKRALSYCRSQIIRYGRIDLRFFIDKCNTEMLPLLEKQLSQCFSVFYSESSYSSQKLKKETNVFIDSKLNVTALNDQKQSITFQEYRNCFNTYGWRRTLEVFADIVVSDDMYAKCNKLMQDFPMVNFMSKFYDRFFKSLSKERKKINNEFFVVHDVYGGNRIVCTQDNKTILLVADHDSYEKFLQKNRSS